MTFDPMTFTFRENNLHISPYNFQMHMPIQNLDGCWENGLFQHSMTSDLWSNHLETFWKQSKYQSLQLSNAYANTKTW